MILGAFEKKILNPPPSHFFKNKILEKLTNDPKTGVDSRIFTFRI